MNKRCGLTAMFRYVWPGTDEKFICLAHSIQLNVVAHALGLYLQIIPLSDKEMETAVCSQIVKDDDVVSDDLPFGGWEPNEADL